MKRTLLTPLVLLGCLFGTACITGMQQPEKPKRSLTEEKPKGRKKDKKPKVARASVRVQAAEGSRSIMLDEERMLAALQRAELAVIAENDIPALELPAQGIDETVVPQVRERSAPIEPQNVDHDVAPLSIMMFLLSIGPTHAPLID